MQIPSMPTLCVDISYTQLYTNYGSSACLQLCERKLHIIVHLVGSCVYTNYTQLQTGCTVMCRLCTHSYRQNVQLRVVYVHTATDNLQTHNNVYICVQEMSTQSVGHVPTVGTICLNVGTLCTDNLSVLLVRDNTLWGAYRQVYKEYRFQVENVHICVHLLQIFFAGLCKNVIEFKHQNFY